MTAGTTRADTFTYTVSATVSGVLDGTVFTNSLVTLALTGDTANIFTVPGVTPLAFQINGTASVSVSGVGSDTFSDVIAVYSFNSTAGFTDVSLGNVGIFGDGSSPFVSYDLSTPIGPIVGTPKAFNFTPFNTLSGTFQITSISGPATFTAAPVPEPSSLLLLGTGFLGLLGAIRRKWPA